MKIKKIFPGNNETNWRLYGLKIRWAIISKNLETKPERILRQSGDQLRFDQLRVALNLSGNFALHQPFQPPRTRVPADAKRFRNRYFKFCTAPRISWTDAQRACEKAGGRLAIFPDEAHRDFIQTLKGNKKVAWIGASIGEDDKLRWLDGQEVALKVRRPKSKRHYLSIGTAGA